MNKKLFVLLSLPLVCACSFSVNELDQLIRKANEDDGFVNIFAGVKADHAPGIYYDGFELNLKGEEGSKIYVQKDLYSAFEEYTGPIKIERQHYVDDVNFYPLTTSVDAVNQAAGSSRCYSWDYINNIQNTGNYRLYDLQHVINVKYVSPSGNETKRTLSYFLNDSKVDLFTIPVISLSMPYDNWFTGSDGIYNNIHLDNSKYGTIEYFDPTNNESWQRNTKIKLGGNWSKGYPQRTLNVNFNKDENGKKNDPITAKVFGDAKKKGFPDEDLGELVRFRIHNSGNCFEEETGVNDTLLHNLMVDTNVTTTCTRPCITYLNGEYWGLYYIREHYSDVFIQNNYKINKDNVVIYEYKGDFNFDDGGDKTKGDKFLKETLAYLDNDFTKDSTYQTFIDEYIDVDSFIDLFIAESFAGNWDFVGNNNNLKMWRCINVSSKNPYEDGRWRFGLHDADFAFNYDYNMYISKNVNNSYYNFRMFRKLMLNKNFRQRFYERAEELLATNLSELNSCLELDRLITTIKPFKLESQMRWGKSQTYYDTWMNNVNDCFAYLKTRCGNYLKLLKGAMQEYE